MSCICRALGTLQPPSPQPSLSMVRLLLLSVNQQTALWKSGEEKSSKSSPRGVCRDHGKQGEGFPCWVEDAAGVVFNFLKLIFLKTIICQVCIVKNITEPPSYVFWFHNSRMINYGVGGVEVFIHKQHQTLMIICCTLLMFHHLQKSNV